VRPLRHAAGGADGDGGPAYGRPGARGPDGRRPSGGGKAERLADVLWDLARTATRLRVPYPDAAELTEATAALHDLAIGLADESSAVARLAELAGLQARLDPGIRVMTNGPYLVTNAGRLLDWLGQPLPVRPQLALCRCGGSRIKPLCDGTHAAIGLAGDKDPGQVQGRLDIYPGQQVTVYDNRGICQHSGFCTNRLAAVFRQGREPFVAPSGGRMDEIIRAVRDCPSGALSYGIDGEEARDEVDWHGKREPAIEVTRDGPTGSPAGFRSPTARATTSSAIVTPPASTMRCADADIRRTSRSAAACTITSGSPTRPLTRTGSRPSSSGPAGCRR
jgi:uncharacterized Fe-S cluster protein YjdI/CDGSH-type Zn-finger protein